MWNIACGKFKDLKSSIALEQSNRVSEKMHLYHIYVHLGIPMHSFSLTSR